MEALEIIRRMAVRYGDDQIVPIACGRNASGSSLCSWACAWSRRLPPRVGSPASAPGRSGTTRRRRCVGDWRMARWHRMPNCKAPSKLRARKDRLSMRYLRGCCRGDGEGPPLPGRRAFRYVAANRHRLSHAYGTHKHPNHAWYFSCRNRVTYRKPCFFSRAHRRRCL